MLPLLFRTEDTVSGIAEAWYNVAVLVQMVIQCSDENIDIRVGDPHKRWSMWFNSKQREEPYQVLTSF